MEKTLHNQALYAIVDISKLVTSSRNFFEIKDEIVRKMLEVIPAKKACVNIFEPGHQKEVYLVCHDTLSHISEFFGNHITESGIKLSLDQYPRYISEAIDSRKHIYIKDLEKDPRAEEELPFARAEGYVGRAVFPFVSGDDVLGFMTCFLMQGEELSSEDISFLDSVASFLGMSIEFTRHNGDLDRIVNRLRNTLHSISEATDELYLKKDINSFLTMISEQACRFTESEASFIIIEDHVERMNVAANYGKFDNITSLIRFVVEQKKLKSLRKSFMIKDIPPALIRMGVRSLVYENLIKEDRDVGSLIVINSERYNTDDMKILSIYSSQIMLSLIMYLDSRKLFEKQMMERDIEVIAKQQELIMSERHMELLDGTILDYHYTPSKQIGGDFCKLVQVDEKKAIIFIADVMGHGILSNYFVAMMKGILKTLLYENLWPKEILSKMNAILFSDLDTLNLFITARIIMLDCENQVMISANAGHPVPIVAEKGKSPSIDFFGQEGGVPMGIIEEIEYEQKIYDVSKVEMICLYTDGLIEATNRKKEQFGVEGLTSFLDRQRDQAPNVITDSIQKEIMHFTQSEAAEDDMMIVVIKKPTV